MKYLLCLIFLNLVFVLPAHSFLGFQKKTKPVVEEKLSEDDKIDFVDRSDKDLSTLKSIKLFVPDSLDANSVFKIKSILQDNEKIYKVTHSDDKNFVVYFKNNIDANLVLDLVSAAGFTGETK